jgi:hypothetical protein
LDYVVDIRESVYPVQYQVHQTIPVVVVAASRHLSAPGTAIAVFCEQYHRILKMAAMDFSHHLFAAGTALRLFYDLYWVLVDTFLNLERRLANFLLLVGFSPSRPLFLEMVLRNNQMVKADSASP